MLPTLRERKRYLVFEIISDKAINNAQNVQRAIEQAALNYGGSAGVANAGILFLKDYYKHNHGVIRVAHNAVDDLKTALTFITHIDDTEVAIRSVKTAGSIKKTELTLIAS